MLIYDRQTKPGLVALYDIRPGNGAGPFLQPRSPHGLGNKELKPRQPYERLLRQSITGHCVRWCENESDAVSSGDHRSRRERGGVTGVGRGARQGW